MPFTSLRGRKVGYNQRGLLFDGRPVGTFPARSPRGNVFFVDSAVAAGEGTSPDTALATLNSAFSLCTANQGDTIYVLPNHAETITGAGGITHNKAGVSVIGLGTYNQRPRFLMDGGTTVTYLVSAADAYIEGLEFASGHSNVATCFDVTASGAHLHNCKFRNNTTNEDFLTCIKASGAANTGNGLTVSFCDWYTTDTDDAAFITVVDNLNDLTAYGNIVVTASATAAQLISVASGKLLLNARLLENVLQNKMTAGELFFSSDASTHTGVALNNYVDHRDVTTTHDTGIEGSGIGMFNFFSNSTAGTQGGVIPAADTNS